MIITTNLMIKEIKDGEIIGYDISDNKEYVGRFFTDIDVKKCPYNIKPKDFKSTKISQKMLEDMIILANNFNEREKIVKNRFDEKIENNELYKSLKLLVKNLEDNKIYIYEEDDFVRITNKELQEKYNVKKIDKTNYEEMYNKIKEELTIQTNSILKIVNEEYDLKVNSAIKFSGNLIDNVIISKNAYVDKEGNLTGRNCFYRVGVSGDYYSQDLVMALRILRHTNETSGDIWYSYIVDKKWLTKNKIFHLIKRNITTLEVKKEKILLINFLITNNGTEVEEIEKFNKLVNEFKELNKLDLQEDEKQIKTNEYRNLFIEELKKIQQVLEDETKLKLILNNYSIRLPINNNYELFKSVEEYASNELKIIKNVHKKLLSDVCEYRSLDSGKSVEEIKNNMDIWLKNTLLEKCKVIKKYSCYFRIAGIKDINNEKHGFITEVENSSQSMKNLIGLCPNFQEIAIIKTNIINKLEEWKKDLEKKVN